MVTNLCVHKYCEKVRTKVWKYGTPPKICIPYYPGLCHHYMYILYPAEGDSAEKVEKIAYLLVQYTV